MKKLIMLSFGAMACAMLSGCLSGAVTKGGSYAALPEPKPDEYRIHYDNSPKPIEVSATVTQYLQLFTVGDDGPIMLRDKDLFSFWGQPFIMQAKNAALYKACQESKSDVILAATYEIVCKNYFVFRTATCTIKGYPAKMTGIEKVGPVQK